MTFLVPIFLLYLYSSFPKTRRVYGIHFLLGGREGRGNSHACHHDCACTCHTWGMMVVFFSFTCLPTPTSGLPLSAACRAHHTLPPTMGLEMRLGRCSACLHTCHHLPWRENSGNRHGRLCLRCLGGPSFHATFLPSHATFLLFLFFYFIL